jgi:hypothetical protein
MTKLVEIAPNRWRFVRDATPVARSALPRPYVISDAMPPTEQVDGRFYESKAAFRAVGRALGLTEVGNEKFKPKSRATDAPFTRKQRREVIRKAAVEYAAGRRAKVYGNTGRD